MKVKIDYEGKRKFVAKTRGHEVVIDLPEEKKGENSGPTPPEVFISSLGACMGVYAVSYLEVAGFDASGLSIDLDWDYSEDGKRIGRVTAEVRVGGIDLGKKEKGLIASIEKCIIHNTLHNSPDLETKIISG